MTASTELAIPRRSSLPDKLDYARALAAADLLPANFKKQPANVLWAVEYAEALRLPTIAAITGVHVMDGKPTPSAALMSALVRRAGHRLRLSHDPNADGVCGMAWCEITRADDPSYTFRTEWTVERAVAAELCEIRAGKIHHRTKSNKTGNWQKYPVAMMKARALAECARDACEEALMGMHYVAEELGADVDADGDPIVITATATREAAQTADEPASDTADVAEESEPDWDALIAEVERTGNITPAWKAARKYRPDDAALRERIQAASQVRRTKAAAAPTADADTPPAADEVVDAEIVEPNAAPGPSVEAARAALTKSCKDNAWDDDIVQSKWLATVGHSLDEATDAARVEQFRRWLFDQPQASLMLEESVAVNGTAT